MTLTISLGNWADMATALSIGSVILASFGGSLPEPYSKYALAASVGLANGAVLCEKHKKSNVKEKETT